MLECKHTFTKFSSSVTFRDFFSNSCPKVVGTPGKWVQYCTNASSEQNVYNRRKAGISTAIALSVLIPFVIIAGCFLVRMREVVQGRGNQRIEQRNEPSNVRNRLSSDPKIQTKNATENDQNGEAGGEIARKNSKHEGTYYTNEPLDYYTRN